MIKLRFFHGLERDLYVVKGPIRFTLRLETLDAPLILLP